MVSDGIDSGFEVLEGLIRNDFDGLNDFLEPAIGLVRFYRNLESSLLVDVIPHHWTFISELTENILKEFLKESNAWLDPISV